MVESDYKVLALAEEDMSDEFKDRRQFLRIPMASVVQLGLDGHNLGKLTLLELDIEEKNVLTVELDRDVSPPGIEFSLKYGNDEIKKTIAIDPGNFVSLRVPLLEEPEKDVHMPMVSMIRLTTARMDSLAAMLVDISAGGARIMCQFPLLKHDDITLKIPLPGDEAVEVTGRIVWARQMKLMKEYNFGVEYMVGIQFHDHSQKIREYIHKHMNR